MSDTIESMRTTYMKGELDEASAAENPFAQFKTWIGQVLAAELHEPNAVTVATVDAHGQPSARIVLLRGWDEHGFVFFTNYDSQKGHEIDGQHRAALLFYWGELERQVRIEGSAVRLSDEESDAYFAKRPRGHRLSAWASPQSRVVDDRAYLELRMEAFDEQYHDVEVPRPPYWGGYRIVPARFEFWQGRPNRVHDRLVYRTTGHDWHRERIAP